MTDSNYQSIGHTGMHDVAPSEVEILRGLLLRAKRYMFHTHECSMFIPPYGCRCGFRQAISDINRQLESLRC